MIALEKVGTGGGLQRAACAACPTTCSRSARGAHHRGPRRPSPAPTRSSSASASAAASRASSSARRFELQEEPAASRSSASSKTAARRFESEVWATSTPCAPPSAARASSRRSACGSSRRASSTPSRPRSSSDKQLGLKRACARRDYYEKQSEGTAMLHQRPRRRDRVLLLDRRDDRRDDHDVRRGRATASARSARCARSASRAAASSSSFLLESIVLAVARRRRRRRRLARRWVSCKFSMMNFATLVRDRLLASSPRREIIVLRAVLSAADGPRSAASSRRSAPRASRRSRRCVIRYVNDAASSQGRALRVAAAALGVFRDVLAERRLARCGCGCRTRHAWCGQHAARCGCAGCLCHA